VITDVDGIAVKQGLKPGNPGKELIQEIIPALPLQGLYWSPPDYEINANIEQRYAGT